MKSIEDFKREFKSHPNWICDNPDKEMVDFAEEFAKFLSNYGSYVSGAVALTTSQLRKFFGAIKALKLQNEGKRKDGTNDFEESAFVMILPKLAYAVGRQKKNAKGAPCRIEDFKKIMDEAISLVLKSEDKSKAFKNFISFFEAIVAYHKVYGEDK